MLNYHQFLAENLINMSWKHWPYWLRGGVIGGGVTAVSIVPLYLCDLIVTGYGDLGCGLAFLIISPMFPLFWLSARFGPFPVSIPVFMVAGVIIWFIIGALIGLGIGRIISRNNRGYEKSPPA